MATFVTDSFTDTSGTNIESHTGEVGATWVEHTALAGGQLVISDANRVRSNSSTADMVYASGLPASADYSVFGTIVMRSDNNGSAMGICGRLATGADTCYLFRYNTSGTNQWQLLRLSGGASSTIQAVNATITVDQAYAIELRMTGSTIEGYVDGVLTCSGTNSDVTAAGRAGIRTAGTASNTAGVHLDNFSAADPAAATFAPPPFSRPWRIWNRRVA